MHRQSAGTCNEKFFRVDSGRRRVNTARGSCSLTTIS